MIKGKLKKYQLELSIINPFKSSLIACLAFVLIFQTNSLFSQNNAIEISHDYLNLGLGSAICIYKSDGITEYAQLKPDIAGTGGYFRILDRNGNNFFTIDGNNPSNGGSGQVRVTGNSSTTTFNLGQTGDDSVKLPEDAINAISEGINPMGGANKILSGFKTINSAVTIVLTEDIFCPSSGYVMVIGSGTVRNFHYNGDTDWCELGISDSGSTLPSAQDIRFTNPPNSATGSWKKPFLVQGFYSVAPGTHSFYLNAEKSSDNTSTVSNANLSLVYIPTGYGSIETNIVEDSTEH